MSLEENVTYYEYLDLKSGAFGPEVRTNRKLQLLLAEQPTLAKEPEGNFGTAISVPQRFKGDPNEFFSNVRHYLALMGIPCMKVKDHLVVNVRNGDEIVAWWEQVLACCGDTVNIHDQLQIILARSREIGQLRTIYDLGSALPASLKPKEGDIWSITKSTPYRGQVTTSDQVALALKARYKTFPLAEITLCSAKIHFRPVTISKETRAIRGHAHTALSTTCNQPLVLRTFAPAPTLTI